MFDFDFVHNNCNFYAVGDWCDIRTFSDAMCAPITSGKIYIKF